MSWVRRVLALVTGQMTDAELRRQEKHDRLMAKADAELARIASIEVNVNRTDAMRESFRRAGQRLGR